MKTYKVPRPSQKHIQKMLKKAKEVDKKQAEILESSVGILSKIEGTLKTSLAY